LACHLFSLILTPNPLKTSALIKKSKQLKIKRVATPFKSIHSVLICWDANQSRSEVEELKTFGHELRKSGKEITFLTFHPIKKLGPDMLANELYKLCCKADFNLFKLPKSANIKAIMDQSFDLFINASLVPNEYLNAIAVYTKSKFRIGPFNNIEDTYFYELCIKPNGADLIENYLIEIGKSLNKIK
jgi:hypothetical protein